MIREGRNMGKLDRGQSATEYAIIFAIVVLLSVIMVGKIPNIFRGYANSATGAMTR